MSGDIQRNCKIPQGRKIRSDITNETICRVRAFQHLRKDMDVRQQQIISGFYLLPMDRIVNLKLRHCYVEIWVILKVLHWMKSRRRFKLLKEC